MSMHRKGFSKALYNRRLATEDIPKTWAMLKDDGVWYKPTRTGYQFYCGRYAVNNSSICQAWNISRNGVMRIAEWLSTQSESVQCEEGWDWE